MMNRREMLAGLGSFAAVGALGRLEAAPQASQLPASVTLADFPRKADFNIEPGYTYISGAYTHPMPIAAAEAYRRHVERRSTLSDATAPNATDPKAAFAALINAKPSEISYIPNASTGENLVVEVLGIKKFDGNVVTDALHFEGALIHLMELKKQGLDLRVAPVRDGRIDTNDLERLVDNKTRLVEVSFVSMYNGFQHDLKKVCDLAHAHGAYVYADIIQGVGAVPFDVRATGLDFAACATYKWLMGDFGLGFFFVREELLGRVVQRPHWSYGSAPNAALHLSPTDPQYPNPVTWTPGRDAASHFQLGTMANGVAAALGVSIPYIQQLGVVNIQAHRQPLLRRLQQEMPRLGFAPQTPRDSTSPIVTFAHKDATAIQRKLQAARVNVRVADYWMRIAPSVYNDMGDIDRLVEALSR
ncbi:MAG: aminotransferase class V-fold PLP-dependent enzyme [Gemmatimonadota bacterium]